jgi:hypothetical protein
VGRAEHIERRRTFTGGWVRVAGFLLLTAGVYLAALRLCSRIRVGEHTLLQHLTHNPLEPGGRYQSLRRFREAEGWGDVDIVFFGSSHGYRAFDPRLFGAAGYRVYNLSSTNQTPLNAYYLAERYLRGLSPELVVVEVYYHTLTLDGLESCRDLAVNTPSSWPMARMAIATRHLGALSFAVAKGLGLVADESRAEQRAAFGEVYVAGGYCEARGRRAALEPGPPFSVEVLPRQLEYLKDTSALARSLGAQVVWVTHPFPEDHRRRIANYRDVTAQIGRAAAECGVAYWDFNDRLTLDSLEDFQDFHHLSSSGVEKFDRALLEALRSSGLSPAASMR